MMKKMPKSGKSKDSSSIMVTIAIILVVLVVAWLIYDYMKKHNSMKEKFSNDGSKRPRKSDDKSHPSDDKSHPSGQHKAGQH